MNFYTLHTLHNCLPEPSVKKDDIADCYTEFRGTLRIALVRDQSRRLGLENILTLELVSLEPLAW